MARGLGGRAARASTIPAAPVAAFAIPELITTACGSASSRWRRETSTGAACTRLVVHTAPPTARGTERTSARSGDALPDPSGDAARLEPESRGHGHQTSTPESRRPGGLVEAEEEVDVLDRLAGGALAEVVDRADDHGHSGEPVLEDADLGAVGLLDPAELGNDALGQHRDDVALRVVLLEQRAQVGAGRAHVARRDEPPADREQVRDERDREAEERGDLGRVLVVADAVGGGVLEHGAGVRARGQRPARARRPRLRVHDDALAPRSPRGSATARGGRRSRSSPGSRPGAPPAGSPRGARTTTIRAAPGSGAGTRTSRRRPPDRRSGARRRGRRRRSAAAPRRTPPARAAGTGRRRRRRSRGQRRS